MTPGGGPAEPGRGRTIAELAEVPVDRVKRIGEKRAEALRELGIETVADLLMYYPRRYLDRTRQSDVADVGVGEEAVIVAEVVSTRYRRTQRGRALVELEVDDQSGRLRVVFFKQLPAGTQAMFFGKLDTYRGKRQLTNPVVDLIGNRTGRIVPIYPTTEASGIAGWEYGEWIEEALKRASPIGDPVPGRYLADLGMAARGDALSGIHHPESFEEKGAARRRLAFDELLRLQLEVVMRRQESERDARGIRHAVEPADGEPNLVRDFKRRLAFELTKAQEQAIAEIDRDLAGPLPMHRLLQGDVGSGKTVVAACALLTGIQGGYQGAFMAPTEVLAEQHFFGLRALLGALEMPDQERLGGTRPVAVALLTSRTGARERARVYEELVGGSIDLVVGTHALLTGEVRFSSLGVVVIDEQHRFGVEQRAALRSKGRGESGDGSDPDVLVMTATPIPRTAAMVVFGDLDMTLLDELPSGRTPVRTIWSRTDRGDAEIWEHVRSEVAAGNRAFVVCPLVDGSERVEARSATAEMLRLSQTALSGLAVGLLHGQMKASEKEPVMSAFRSGEIQVLVATTVIEVGVDVPEATVMVIEDADRFGIAQLHQLRGRVGRSDRPSWCYLLSRNDSPEAAMRLGAMESSTDGFELAEVDLEVRGEGTILGSRQKGRSDLKLATLRPADRRLVVDARNVAESILAEDPYLERHTDLADELRLFLGEEAAFLRKG